MLFPYLGEGDGPWSWPRIIIQGGIGVFLWGIAILIVYHMIFVLIRAMFGVTLPHLG